MTVSGRALMWVLSLVFYVLFFWWYTNTGGALSEDEIEAFVAQMQANGSSPDRIARLQRFMAEDTGDQLLMVNILHMAETPAPAPGVLPGETSEEVMGRYMAYMYPAMLKRASHPVFFGRAIFSAMDLVGIEGAETWSQAAIVRYRSRRDLLEIALYPDFGDRHRYKVAALEKTVAFPVAPVVHPGEPRLLLFIVLLALVAVADILIRGRRRGTGA